MYSAKQEKQLPRYMIPFWKSTAGAAWQLHVPWPLRRSVAASSLLTPLNLTNRAMRQHDLDPAIQTRQLIRTYY